jgi:ornithine carbamoyltransferase
MKHFINLIDISTRDLRKIFTNAKKRKERRKNLSSLDVDKDAPLKGKLLIQMFEKSSLRTRISFYLAIRQLGGSALTLRPDELHITKGGESMHDTAKILSNYGDVFMLRTDDDDKLKEFKKHLDIPIINGLSPSSHPTQICSDIFTIEEIKKKQISNLNICWIGDCNNVLNSLFEIAKKFLFNLNIGCPKKYQSKLLLNWTKKNKGKINLFDNAKKAAINADIIFTDKVISMNDKVNKTKKLKDFENFQVNSKLMSYAKKNSCLFHCLPASRGKEISQDVIDGKQSRVWQQAQNRVHVQKSILLYCLGKLR